MRLNKFISESGLCSRREADHLIETGQVTVNVAPIADQPSLTPKSVENEKTMLPVLKKMQTSRLKNRPNGRWKIRLSHTNAHHLPDYPSGLRTVYLKQIDICLRVLRRLDLHR